MEHLYAPWRSNYITSHTAETGCALCLSESGDDDAKRYVIKRYEHSYIMLNLYPYNAGHVMVIPYKHVGTLSSLTPEARAEIINNAALCEKVLKQELQAEGFNIGCNVGGKISGGTIPEHLHLHVLPRFLGDTNFLPLLSNTKQISLDLNVIYLKLKDAFK